MKPLHIFALIVLCLCFSAPAFAAKAEFALEGDTLFVLKAGKKKVPISNSCARVEVKGSEMTLVSVGEEDGKAHKIPAGFCLFDGKGSFLSFSKMEDAENCGGASLSPDGKTLAVDTGTFLIRDCCLFSFPALKPIERLTCFSRDGALGVTWAKGGRVAVFMSMETAGHKRNCGYDPCGPVSVKAFTIATKQSVTLAEGTNLCDFSLLGMESDDEVSVGRLCLSSPKEWENYPEGIKPKSMIVPLR